MTDGDVSGTATWTSVEAVCNCPHRVKSWHTFIDRSRDVTLDEAKDNIREAVYEHFEEKEWCSVETVTMKVYREEEVQRI